MKIGGSLPRLRGERAAFECRDRPRAVSPNARGRSDDPSQREKNVICSAFVAASPAAAPASTVNA